MRSKLLLTLLVFLVSLTLCLLSLLYVSTAFRTLDEMRENVLRQLESGHEQKADTLMAEFETAVRERETMLEMLTPHDDLHDLFLTIVDARKSLALRDMDDFYKEMNQLGETIRHLKDHEALRISNIF